MHPCRYFVKCDLLNRHVDLPVDQNKSWAFRVLSFSFVYQMVPERGRISETFHIARNATVDGVSQLGERRNLGVPQLEMCNSTRVVCTIDSLVVTTGKIKEMKIN